MSDLSLPEGWKKVTLGELGVFKNGINKSKEDFGNGYPFVNLLDIFGKNFIAYPDIIGLVKVSVRELKIYDLKESDTFFVRSSVKPEGVGLTCVLDNDLPETVYSGFIIRFRPKSDDIFDKKFLRYCFYSNYFRKALLRKSSISANTNINQQSLQKLQLLVPPLPEQKAIADLLSTWDTAIEKTESLIAAKERQFEWLRSSIIKSTKNTKAQKFGDFLNESRTLDTISNPEKRLTVRLHLKGVDVREYRGTEKEGTTQYFVRKAGQLIYGKQNIFRGSIGIIPHVLDGYSSSQDIPAFDIGESVNADWLYWYMSRPSFYERLEHFSAGSGSKRLHPKELFRMHVDVPLMEDQKCIASTLNTARQEIDLLKKLLDQYRTQKRGLMQKLLTGEWRIKNGCLIKSGMTETGTCKAHNPARHSCASRNP